MNDLYVGVTNNNWFKFLRERKPDEVNFWRPSGKSFQALEPGGLFVFKLHSPHKKLAGFGIYVRSSVLPLKLAWEAFGEKNGVSTLEDFQDIIARHRGGFESNPMIGCIILAQPIFFENDHWKDQPRSWASSIVSGKGYQQNSSDGKYIYEFAREQLQLADLEGVSANTPAYAYRMQKVRLGQGAFRVLVTDTYQRRCAISGERTLPALEAAHIKPYRKHGPHEIRNGLLLRSDIHKVFDDGYMTVTDDYRIEVSRQLREDYDNGKDYYKFHGQELIIMPNENAEKPMPDYLRWHNENIYRG